MLSVVILLLYLVDRYIHFFFNTVAKFGKFHSFLYALKYERYAILINGFRIFADNLIHLIYYAKKEEYQSVETGQCTFQQDTMWCGFLYQYW